MYLEPVIPLGLHEYFVFYDLIYNVSHAAPTVQIPSVLSPTSDFFLAPSRAPRIAVELTKVIHVKLLLLYHLHTVKASCLFFSYSPVVINIHQQKKHFYFITLHCKMLLYKNLDSKYSAHWKPFLECYLSI